MSDMPPTGGSFSWGQLVAGGLVALGSLGAAAVAFRNWIVSSATGVAGDQAQIEIIRMLREQVERESARADAASAARDAALDQMRGMKEQMTAMSNELTAVKLQLVQVQSRLGEVAHNTSLTTGTP